MKVFRYLFLIECMVIVAIFIWYEDNVVGQKVFELFKTIFPIDTGVVSQIYYQESKITSSLSIIFTALNITYLLFYFRLYYKDILKKEKHPENIYNIEIKNIFLFIVFGVFSVWFDYKGLVLKSYYTSRMMPLDGLFSAIFLSISMLVVKGFYIVTFIVGIRCLFFKIFRK